MIDQPVTIFDTAYFFCSNPFAASYVYMTTGRKGTVYQLRDSHGRFFALKIFHPRFRSSQIDLVSTLLRKLKRLPGMRAADRVVLSLSNSNELISQYPELEYSVLMPWINSETFFDIFLTRKPITHQESINLALKLGQALSTLEAHGLAHADVSATNVMASILEPAVAFVGLENFYGTNFPEPIGIPAGTVGYAHPIAATQGQWCAAGDRFAGAILISEILGWSDDRIRNSMSSSDETYFEKQVPGMIDDRYVLLYSTLESLSYEIANLFKDAWFSSTLSDCPSLKSWSDGLSKLI